MTRLRGTILAAAVPLLLVGACANNTTAAGSAPASPSAGAPTTEGTTAPAANDLVLRVESYGGFVAPDQVLGKIPTVSVYGDGRVIAEGPVPQIYPGPALPNLQVFQITPEEVQALIKQGLDAGVRNGADLGQPNVADAPITRITVVGSGGKQIVTANALDQAQGQDPKLTPAQQNARAKLAAYEKKLTALPARPNGSAYQPTAMAVFANTYVPPANGAPASPAKAWAGPALPGTDIDAATRAGCVTVTGAQLGQVLAGAKQGNALTPWTAGGKKWHVIFRPLLPDETSCASVKSAR